LRRQQQQKSENGDEECFGKLFVEENPGRPISRTGKRRRFLGVFSPSLYFLLVFLLLCPCEEMSKAASI
jgi:hypothetical protein